MLKVLWIMRFSAPALFAASLVAGYFAYGNGSYVTMGIDSFLAGMNLVLTWIEWVIFQPWMFRRI